MDKFKKAFRRLPDPRADNARHELLEVLFIALAATLCGAEGPSDMATFGHSKEGLLRLVLQLQHGVPSHDTFSRVFRLLDPQAFEAAFRRFMAASPRPTDWNCAAWWRWTAKPCGVPSSVAGKAPRCTWSTSGRRKRECAWLSARPLAATRQRAPWRSWACWTSKAVSLPRMHCTAIATLPPRCSSGVRITCWRSRKTRASCSLRPLGAMPAAEPAALPNGANPPLTIAANGGARPSCAIPLSPRSSSSPASLRWPASPRADVRLVRVRSLPRSLLPALQIYSRQAAAAHRALPLGYREPAALGARCRLQRGSQPNSERQRAREPCDPPKARPQPGPQSPRSHVPAPENQTCGVGRRLPLGHAQSYAIALPLGGRGGEGGSSYRPRCVRQCYPHPQPLPSRLGLARFGKYQSDNPGRPGLSGEGSTPSASQLCGAK